MYVFEIYQGRNQLDVSPIYGEDFSIDVELQEGERFCRSDMSGKFTFVNKDFDFFVNNGLNPVYKFKVVWVVEEGYPHRFVVREAEFSLADMDLDYDSKIASLSLEGKDIYEDFLNKYDAQYDLVKLAPPKRNVDIYKRSFLQIYVLGDTKLTHILGNTEYEIEASSTASQKNGQQVSDMGFTLLSRYVVVDVKTAPEWNLQKYDGIYTGDRSTKTLWRLDDQMRMVKATDEYGGWNILPKDGYSQDYFYLKVSLFDTLEFSSQIMYWPSDSGTRLYGGSAKGSNRDVYGRVILDNVNASTSSIKSDDVWEKNLNYRYYYKIPFGSPMYTRFANNIRITLETTDVPNQWKTDDKGRYFVPPAPIWNRDRVIAIGWNQWIPMAIWYNNSADDTREFLAQFDEQWTLKDAYDLRDVINILLKQTDLDIKGVWSDFLDNVAATDEYGDPLLGTGNPILGYGTPLWLYITPITNIKKTFYEQAAQKGKISLRQILDMLKTCFQCYWYIEYRWVNGVYWKFLRIEQAEWFDLGGHYAWFYPVKANPYYDLTEYLAPVSGNSWMTDQQKCRYELDGLWSRMSFSWGDKSTEIFNGYPIVATDAFVKNKKTEERKVENFTADIDIIESSPEVLSNDMYVVLGADGDEGGMMRVPIGNVGYYPDMMQHPIYNLQNPLLSFFSLEQNFWRHDMPGASAEPCELEGLGLPLRAKSLKKILTQSVASPMLVTKPDLCMEIVRTGLQYAEGDGSIRSIRMNPFTHSAEIELLFNDKN